MGNRDVQPAATALAIILLSAAVLAPPPARAERVLVFAAASLNAPLTEIARAHERKSGNRVRISFAASSALARQIDNGAPADLYVSANMVWINWLEARGGRLSVRIDRRKIKASVQKIQFQPGLNPCGR